MSFYKNIASIHEVKFIPQTLQRITEGDEGKTYVVHEDERYHDVPVGYDRDDFKVIYNRFHDKKIYFTVGYNLQCNKCPFYTNGVCLSKIWGFSCYGNIGLRQVQI